jgi:hypothetical protein
MGAAEVDDAKAATTTRIIAKENKGVICVTNKYEGSVGKHSCFYTLNDVL